MLRPRPLTPVEQLDAARHLRTAEYELFWRQAPADQRHAYETMRRASLESPDPTVLRAALLHDVGKATVELGAVRRSLATVLDALGLPMTSRMRSYRDHGPRGAGLLAAAGAEPLVVAFAARHPDADPGEFDPAMWSALLDADDI